MSLIFKNLSWFTKNFHFAFWFDAKALFFMNRHFSFRGLFLPAVFIANLKVFIAARKPQFKWELTCNSLSLCSKGCKKVHSMNCWLGCIKLTDTFYKKQWVLRLWYDFIKRSTRTWITHYETFDHNISITIIDI